MARVAVGRAMAVGLAALAEAGLERSRTQVADGGDLVEQFAAVRDETVERGVRHGVPRFCLIYP